VFRATLHSAGYADLRCTSVNVYVSYRNEWTYPQTFFTSWLPHHSRFFSYQTLWQYSHGDPL